MLHARENSWNNLIWALYDLWLDRLGGSKGVRHPDQRLIGQALDEESKSLKNICTYWRQIIIFSPSYKPSCAQIDYIVINQSAYRYINKLHIEMPLLCIRKLLLLMFFLSIHLLLRRSSFYIRFATIIFRAASLLL